MKLIEIDDPDRPLALIGRLTRYRVHNGQSTPLRTTTFFVSPAIPWPKVRRVEIPASDGYEIPPGTMVNLKMTAVMARAPEAK